MSSEDFDLSNVVRVAVILGATVLGLGLWGLLSNL